MLTLVSSWVCATIALLRNSSRGVLCHNVRVPFIFVRPGNVSWDALYLFTRVLLEQYNPREFILFFFQCLLFLFLPISALKRGCLSFPRELCLALSCWDAFFAQGCAPQVSIIEGQRSKIVTIWACVSNVTPWVSYAVIWRVGASIFCVVGLSADHAVACAIYPCQARWDTCRANVAFCMTYL